MCIFSQPVNSVNATKIFGRVLPGNGHQVLAYSMVYDHEMTAPVPVGDVAPGVVAGRFQTLEPEIGLAMVLPLPVPPGSADDAVTFIDLSDHDDFFDKLDSLFPQGGGFARGLSLGVEERNVPLVVHDVGDFEASFVPSIPDFRRLDERFQLDEEVWGLLPTYADYGFAVFKLRTGKRKVHPMAFKFPTRDPSQVFFPTVHVHDGEVHDLEEFDHALYAQVFSATGALASGEAWSGSGVTADRAFDDDVCGMITPQMGVMKREVRGRFANADIRVAA